MQRAMQHRFSIICTSLLFLIITKAEGGSQYGFTGDRSHVPQNKELEHNLNNLQHEQYPSPHHGPSPGQRSTTKQGQRDWPHSPKPDAPPQDDKMILTHSPKVNHSPSKEKAKLTNSRRQNPLANKAGKLNNQNLGSYGRRVTRGHSGASNLLENNPVNGSHPYPDPAVPRGSQRRRISRFWMSKNNGGRTGHPHPTRLLLRKMNQEGYQKGFPRGMHRLRLASHRRRRQRAQQRKARSDCTGGKVWRRGQCRCPARSNWDESQSKCVCIYGTYKDSKGNCRSYS